MAYSWESQAGAAGKVRSTVIVVEQLIQVVIVVEQLIQE